MSKTFCSKKIKKWGQQQACNFLKRRGYEVVEKDYSTREEVDIIASFEDDEEKTLSFMKVKTKRGTCEEQDKQVCGNVKELQKMMSTARQFCSGSGYEDYTFNFEHINIHIDKKNQKVNFKKYPLL